VRPQPADQERQAREPGDRAARDDEQDGLVVAGIDRAGDQDQRRLGREHERAERERAQGEREIAAQRARPVQREVERGQRGSGDRRGEDQDQRKLHRGVDDLDPAAVDADRGAEQRGADRDRDQHRARGGREPAAGREVGDQRVAVAEQLLDRAGPGDRRQRGGRGRVGRGDVVVEGGGGGGVHGGLLTSRSGR
jgi:hypothetical protein